MYFKNVYKISTYLNLVSLKNKKNNETEKALPYIHGDLFPVNYKDNKLSFFVHEAMKQVSEKNQNQDLSRVRGQFDAEVYSELAKKYSVLPMQCNDPLSLIKNIAKDFTSGVPIWRSPLLQYNVGAATNSAAVALYALALDMNICNVNDGSAGAALVAEKSVAKILSDLAGVDSKKSFGLFTFGGTATNLYAMKVAIKKVFPKSGVEGIPKNVVFLIMEDAHFSHAVAADWLGLGTENLLVVRADTDRTSSIIDAEKKMRMAIKEGKVIGAIIINGGTTYDHAIDDIPAFAELRDRLVKEYDLSYVPHIHVDAVIGWAWLMFRNYNFENNNLNVSEDALKKIKMQYDRIKHLNLADSWGVDFHKGVGACPIPCSIIIMNNKQDFVHLSKSNNPLTFIHQIARDISVYSPSEYTLETSRPGGAPLAALAALHTLGQYGYQSHLANLVSMSLLTKKIITENLSEIDVCNPQSLGYVTMVRMYPPELAQDHRRPVEFVEKTKDLMEFTNKVNDYMKSFFSWDYETRIKLNQGVEYSYSSTYIKTPLGIKTRAIKFYPTSPNIRENHIRTAMKILLKQKKVFDSEVWNK